VSAVPPSRLLSLAAGTVLGFPPAAVIDAAAAAGFGGVGLRWQQPGLPDPRVDDVRSTIDASGLVLLDLEVVRLQPGVPVGSFRPLADVAAVLGARFLLAVSHHPDPARTADELAAVADWCAGSGVTVAVEPMRFTAVPTFRAASALVRGLGRDDVVVLVDPLHLHRGGETPAVLTEPGSAPIGYAQLCDALLAPPGVPDDLDALAHEARHARLFPGDGELPLADMLAALPADLPCTVEVQNDGWAGVDARGRAREAMRTARRVLDRVAGSPARGS
jgi:sugar phosphate isomerase/epimerase